MKKKILALALSVAFLFAASFVMNTDAADAQEPLQVNHATGIPLPPQGERKIIPTVCVLVSTGEVVGRANDCGPGSANCVDVVCPGQIDVYGADGIGIASAG